MEIERLALRPHQPGVEQRQSISANLHIIADTFQSGNDVAGIDYLHLATADARPHPNQAIGRVGFEHAIVRYALGEDVADWNLKRDGEKIEAGEHVFARRTPRARDSAKVIAIQVYQIKDSFFVELIGIVELAGDNPASVRQRMDVGIDEILVVKADFAAGGIARVIALEGPRP